MLFLLVTLYGAALFTLLQMSQRARKTQETNKKDSNPIDYKIVGSDGVTWKGSNIQENPLKAFLGISISTLYNLDLTSGSYYAEGCVWLKYKQVPEWMREWDQEIYECPLKTIGFINVVEAHDFETKLEPGKPTLDDDGHYIQWLVYSGRFIASSLNLSLFPFETIVLPLCIELDDLYAGESDVKYLAAGQVITAPLSINGYSLNHCQVIPYINTYQTNWGYQYANNYFNKHNFSAYQAFRIETTLTRDPWNSFVNIFLPLIIVIVMVIVITAPLVAIQDYQTKLAIPASALLVLVFLQDGYKKILPPGLNYPTLADLIYTFNMFITIMVFLWSLIQTKLYFASQLNGGQLKQAQLAGLMDNQFF